MRFWGRTGYALSWPFSVHPAEPRALPHHLPVQNSGGSPAEHRAPREQVVEKTDGVQQRPNGLFATRQFRAASGLPGGSKAEKTKALSEEAAPIEAANAVVFTSSWTTRAAPCTTQWTGRLSEGSRPQESAGSHQASEDPSPARQPWLDAARVWGRR